MCRKRIEVPATTRGFEQPRVIRQLFRRRRIIFFVLPFMIFATLPRGQARASDTPDSRRFISNGQLYNAHPESSRLNRKDDWQQENIYVGRSGDPWGTTAIKHQEENVYTSVSPFVNSTYNDTNNQQSADEEKSLTRTRFKRGVIHLYNMVVCATGCNPLVYKGYGCYCGFLGSGYVIDGIDKCCKMHDWCYDATECPMFSEYFVPYYWRCYHGYKPVCAVEHGNWGGSGSCSQRLCECDRSLAECLRRYPCPRTKAVCTSSPWRLVQNLFMIM